MRYEKTTVIIHFLYTASFRPICEDRADSCYLDLDASLGSKVAFTSLVI